MLTHRRPTDRGAVAPDGSSLAHIVNDSGFPCAVQRRLDGLRALDARVVTLPVDGPVTKIVYSEDSRWLACEVAPDGREDHQVWVVSNDPDDDSALRIDGDPDTDGHTDEHRAATLISWQQDTVAISVLGADGISQSRLVHVPDLQHVVVDESLLGELADARDGAVLVRRGRRGQHRMLYRDEAGDRWLYPDEVDSVTDQAAFLHRRGEDGTRWALVRTDHGGSHFRLDLVTIGAERIDAEPIAERDGVDLDEFALSHDDSTAVLAWNTPGGQTEIEVLDVAGHTRSAPLWLPEQVADQLSVSADGSLLALTMQGPGQHPTVDLVDPRNRDWTPVDHIPNDPTQVIPSRIVFASHDGVPLDGWLYRPVGARGPGPVALWFHGGPEGQSRPEHYEELPPIVEAGITLFAPNVRGSSGYGRWFAHADDHERRWDGIKDVVAVVDELVARGIAEPDRIAMCGRSYGGYLTYTALARYPELFAAGIAVCGMSDLTTFYRDTEPWVAAAAYSKYGHPEEDRDLLLALSAMPQVDRIRTPLLSVHGGQDTNVPPSESAQITEALRELGRTARRVVFDDEGHDFSKPENRREQGRIMADFLTEFLHVG